VITLTVVMKLTAVSFRRLRLHSPNKEEHL